MDCIFQFFMFVRSATRNTPILRETIDAQVLSNVQQERIPNRICRWHSVTTRQLTCNMLTLHLKATQLIAAKVNKILRTNFRVAFVVRLL